MTVYVVQKQIRFDKERGTVVPRFPSIVKASKWGEMKFLLSPTAHPFENDVIVGTMHKSMKTFTDQDWLVLTGSPVFLGMATALAAYLNNGRVNFLQWVAGESDYVELRARIY